MHKYTYICINIQYMASIRGAFDVGKDGALVVFEGDTIIYKIVTPKIGDQIDLRKIKEILSTLDLKNIHIVIEDVHAIFGSSAKATFNFGWSLGILEGLLTMAQIPYTKVAPKDWQREMWQGVKPIYKPQKTEGQRKIVDTKATSLLAAQRLFPTIDFRKSERADKPHDGIVDAILMADYCRRKF